MKHTIVTKALAGAALVVGLATTAAPATTLTSANLFVSGDGLLTRDSATLLEWLDLTATTNLSRVDVLADVGGWITAGFRLATRTEIETLWFDHGFPVIDGNFDALNDPFYASFVALLGETAPSDGSSEGTTGFSADSPGPGGAFLPRVLHDLQTDGSGTALIANAANSEAFSDSTVGSWLVRAYTITEPATLGLFSVALLVLGARARRAGGTPA